jgi:hypothetical protein
VHMMLSFSFLLCIPLRLADFESSDLQIRCLPISSRAT